MPEVCLNFASDPGLQPCDRCHRIKLTEWFAGMLLCQDCLHPVVEGIRHDLVEIIGLDAIGKAAERISALSRQNQEMKKTLGGIGQFLGGFHESSGRWSIKIEDYFTQQGWQV